MTVLRLQKYLAECGLGSRRHCEALIASGRVLVNGACGSMGQEIDPSQDAVTVDGAPVERPERVYLLLNKPKGTVTSTRDDDDRETITDLLGGIDKRVFPVGRLEKDIEGALLLTNDGDLSHHLSLPACTVDRAYIATVRGIVNDATVTRAGGGILLEDGATVRARVRILHTGIDSTVLRIGVREGPRARVRHLTAVLGHPVLELRRIVEAGVELGSLEPGQWRPLTAEEVEHLRTQAVMAAAG